MNDVKIFHEFANLSFLNVSIDDMEIIQGDMITLQIDQSFKTGGLIGKLEFKDTYDIFNNSAITLNNNNIVKISFKDFSLDSSVRTYRITNISHRKYNERFRLVSLTLVDEITYILSTSYIDQFYSGDCSIGIKNLIEELCSGVISSNKLKLNVVGNSESTKSEMLCNSSMNVLDFIMQKLSKYNLRFFQTRGEIFIKELILNKIIPLENNYTDKTMNNKYLYKIHDREQLTVCNIGTPKTLNYRIDGKNIVTNTPNFDDMSSEMIINKPIIDQTYIQGKSVKMLFQASFTDGQQKIKIFDNFINTNTMQIVVTGTINGGNIGTVIKCTFNGIIGFTDITTEGDSMNSGNYFVTGVSDLFIGMKYIQKINIARCENIQPRNVQL